MTDKRTCRRCGLEILDDEQFVISGLGYAHLEMWDCVTRLRAENERLCAIPEPYQECFRQLQDERKRLSEQVEAMEKRIQSVVQAWKKWMAAESPSLADYDVFRSALRELEQGVSE